MAIPVAEMAGVLKAVRDKAAEAAPPAVMAMADTYKEHLTRVTLRRSFAAPGQFGTPAAPGGPPAWRTGRLAASVTSRLSRAGGFSASAAVSPHVVYAATQEHGGIHYARRAHYMHWINTGGSWYKKRVDIPARPYLRPAAEECIANGSLTRAAMVKWEEVVWGA